VGCVLRLACCGYSRAAARWHQQLIGKSLVRTYTASTGQRCRNLQAPGRGRHVRCSKLLLVKCSQPLAQAPGQEAMLYTAHSTFFPWQPADAPKQMMAWPPASADLPS
jgi:hypothetical protein